MCPRGQAHALPCSLVSSNCIPCTALTHRSLYCAHHTAHCSVHTALLTADRVRRCAQTHSPHNPQTCHACMHFPWGGHSAALTGHRVTPDCSGPRPTKSGWQRSVLGDGVTMLAKSALGDGVIMLTKSVLGDGVTLVPVSCTAQHSRGDSPPVPPPPLPRSLLSHCLNASPVRQGACTMLTRSWPSVSSHPEQPWQEEEGLAVHSPMHSIPHSIMHLPHPLSHVPCPHKCHETVTREDPRHKGS